MNDPSVAKRQARVMLVLGAPLATTLFLFTPPPEMTSSEARKRAGIAFLASLVLVALAFIVLGYLTAHPHLTFGKVGLPVVLLIAGSGYLLLPASLYRMVFGVPESTNAGLKFLRGIFAFGLFFVTFVGSLILYGQIT